MKKLGVSSIHLSNFILHLHLHKQFTLDPRYYNRYSVVCSKSTFYQLFITNKLKIVLKISIIHNSFDSLLCFQLLKNYIT